MDYAYGMTNNEVDMAGMLPTLNDFETVEISDIIGNDADYAWFTLVSGDLRYAHTNKCLLEDLEAFIKAPGSAVKIVAEALATEGFVVSVYRNCVNDIDGLIRNNPIGQCEPDDTLGTKWVKLY